LEETCAARRSDPLEPAVEVATVNTQDQSLAAAAPESSWKWRFIAIAAFAAFLLLNWSAALPMVLKVHQQGAQDFSIFYTGARIVRSGLSGQLYHLSVQAKFQTPAYQSRPLPFDHPAYELILFLPLAGLSFNAAYWTWIAVSVGIAGCASLRLGPHLSNFPRPAAAWAFFGAMASFPVIWALCQGQDSILLLLIFVLAYSSLKADREFIAGMVLAAGLFKFPLVVPFAVPFFVRRRWRFAGGFLAGSAMVVGISTVITGIPGLREYGQLLSQLVAHPAVGYINPLLMPNARGFLLMLLAGSGVTRQGFDIISAIVSLALLVVPCAMFCSSEKASRFDLWFGLNLSVALLASPHLYWHDLTLLLLPIVLAINSLLEDGSPGGFSLAAAAGGVCVYAAAWLAYLQPLGIYPSAFFLPVCAFALGLAVKLHSSSLHPVECGAIAVE
jgi:hypothetical protein